MIQIGRLHLTASAFNQLGQHTSSPGRRGYCYAELAVFFPAVAVTIASTHCTYHAGMARLSWPPMGAEAQKNLRNKVQHSVYTDTVCVCI